MSGTPETNEHGVSWIGAPDWEDWVWVDGGYDPDKPLSQLLQTGGEDVVEEMASGAGMFLSDETGSTALAVAFFEFSMVFYLDVLRATDEFIEENSSGIGLDEEVHPRAVMFAEAFEEAARRLRAALPAV
tara:strand:+ start:2003 stop:2392 length:390 start_codon:yes stop_codon:yes gene_type:complete